MFVHHRTTRAWLTCLATLLFSCVGFFIPHNALAQDVGSTQVTARRAQLQQDLARLEGEIADQQKILDEKRQENVSLERDVDILNAQIQKSKLSIQARDLSIQKLSEDIGQKQGTIGSLSDKLDREKESLAQLIRKTNEVDAYSIVEIALSNKSVSDFFGDVNSFEEIQSSLRASFEEVTNTRTETEAQKRSLEDKRAEEMQLRGLQVLEKQKIEVQEAEKKRILAQSKGVEKTYQSILAQKQKSAAQIRTELFTLVGSAAIPFEKALDYANAAGKKMGVRPAFILGIVAEESNLGANVGTGNWQTDMHPTRDKPIFAQICSALGLDPDRMPVSKKAWYGWGGAMGPAQFIPSTWVLYVDRIAQATGHNPPNPWDPGDAFMASAILLADNGADRGTRDAERLAALRYLAGWKNATKSSYAFYGDDVMDLADKYQAQIDILKNS